MSLFCISRRGFFNACVRNIQYGKTNSDMKDISNKYIEKNKVTDGCTLNYCDKPVPICKNKGRCKPDGKTKVTCNCLWTGYEGKYCDKGKSIIKEKAIEQKPFVGLEFDQNFISLRTRSNSTHFRTLSYCILRA